MKAKYLISYAPKTTLPYALSSISYFSIKEVLKSKDRSQPIMQNLLE